MTSQPPPGFTTQRTGLEAVVPLYLRDVVVDADGFITDFNIAFLPAEVDPAEIKAAVREAINLDEPHRCSVHDSEDRWLLGHPGSPLPPRRPPSQRRATDATTPGQS